VNDLLVSAGVEAWKPFVEALLMPPVPLLLMVLVGARLMFRRRLLAWTLVLVGVAGVWLMCTVAAGVVMTRLMTMPPRALSPNDIAELKRAPKTAIVVLGAGRKLLAPEYGLSTLKPMTVERLRFGLWLARETSLPVAFSGGIGHGADAGPSEADIAARIAEREFGARVRWTETQSRDTNENAIRTVALLAPEGVERIVLVTHAYHMRRALAAFERARERSNVRITLTPAPMGVDPGGPLRLGDWLPTVEGFTSTRLALHEWVGRLVGA
jgi:uncharacterized SAM-binding protein YcdF (DUF218 family)